MSHSSTPPTVTTCTTTPHSQKPEVQEQQQPNVVQPVQVQDGVLTFNLDSSATVIECPSATTDNVHDEQNGPSTFLQHTGVAFASQLPPSPEGKSLQPKEHTFMTSSGRDMEHSLPVEPPGVVQNYSNSFGEQTVANRNESMLLGLAEFSQEFKTQENQCLRNNSDLISEIDASTRHAYKSNDALSISNIDAQSTVIQAEIVPDMGDCKELIVKNSVSSQLQNEDTTLYVAPNPVSEVSKSKT